MHRSADSSLHVACLTESKILISSPDCVHGRTLVTAYKLVLPKDEDIIAKSRLPAVYVRSRSAGAFRDLTRLRHRPSVDEVSAAEDACWLKRRYFDTRHSPVDPS
jgi:hypothetical protein